ncbi:MAG: glycerophosphodiester phosphodiesterase family protein [Sedimenticolaceae bacterium]|nr:glycerophosphodiester phosphodiesterase family protein [Sedimenticolaceae bacterium]
MKSTSPDGNILWIGHRGSPLHFPENTIEGYRAVLEAGGRHIETDVQFSADGIPFLCHDVELTRLSGIEANLFDLDSETLRHLPAAFPERFGKRFENLRFSPLASLAALLQAHPDVTAFIEIKEESAAHYGVAAVTETVLAVMDAVAHQCVFLSFTPEVVQHLESAGKTARGWVIPEWDDANREIARTLSPQWLFCNRKRLPAANRDLWQGDWNWVLYTINEIETGEQLCKRGFRYLETDRILDILRGQS